MPWILTNRCDDLLAKRAARALARFLSDIVTAIDDVLATRTCWTVSIDHFTHWLVSLAQVGLKKLTPGAKVLL